MKVYKIRNRLTGAWSSGGYNLRWHLKRGKEWTSLSHVKLHLGMFDEDKYQENDRDAAVRADMVNWEIVEYDLVESSVVPVNGVIAQ